MADALRVLLIEDDAATLEYLTLLLETSGYRVQAASTGADAIGEVVFGPIHAILLDRRLPDIDGIALSPLFRHLLGAEVPIIMMTADAETGLLAKAQAGGITRLLRKPFIPRTLLDILSTLLAVE